MAGVKGIKFGKRTTLIKTKGDVIIIENVITTDELERYLERRESRLFGRHKEFDTRKETERRFEKIEETVSDKARVLQLICDLALKEEDEGLTKEEKRLAEILAKLYLVMG